jgi:hypothetical protein
MTSFEYISTLLSIIIGLGITHLLIGVSRLIYNPKAIKIYWIHLLWTLYIFIYMISFWWFEYNFSIIQGWTLQLYLFIILYAVLLFFLCVINMPFHFPEDFKTYYYASRKWFFTVLIFISVVDIIDGFQKGVDYMVGLGIGYALFVTVTMLLSIVAISTRKELAHGLIAIILTLYQVGYLFMAFRTLSG